MGLLTWMRSRFRSTREAPVLSPQTPEQRAQFLEECRRIYLKASGSADCEWHGRFMGEATGCCLHRKHMVKP